MSGNLEGMTLAILTGACHAELRERTGLNRVVEEQNVVLACFWDVEQGEKERLEDSWISAHPADSLALLPVALRQLADRVDGVYFHIGAGLVKGTEDAVGLIGLVRESVPLAAVGVTNYNPDLDADGAWEKAILKALRGLNPRAH